MFENVDNGIMILVMKHDASTFSPLSLHSRLVALYLSKLVHRSQVLLQNYYIANIDFQNRRCLKKLLVANIDFEKTRSLKKLSLPYSKVDLGNYRECLKRLEYEIRYT